MDNGGEEQTLNQNGNGKPHQWDLFHSDAKPDPTPKKEYRRQTELASPVPGNDDLVITPSGKVVPKVKLNNLKRGDNEGNQGPGKKNLPDLTEALIRVLTEEKDGKQALDIILQSMRAKATRGSEKAADLLLNRAYGSHLMRLDEGMIIQPTEPITGFNIKTAHDKGPNTERETD